MKLPGISWGKAGDSYSMALTKKQKLFVEYYAGNATQAAIKAGYSKTSAGTAGCYLMKNGKVLKALKERENREKHPEIADKRERQKFLSDILRDGEMDINYRLKAAELLSKIDGDFSSSVGIDLETNIGVVILPEADSSESTADTEEAV